MGNRALDSQPVYAWHNQSFPQQPDQYQPGSNAALWNHANYHETAPYQAPWLPRPATGNVELAFQGPNQGSSPSTRPGSENPPWNVGSYQVNAPAGRFPVQEPVNNWNIHNSPRHTVSVDTAQATYGSWNKGGYKQLAPRWPYVPVPASHINHQVALVSPQALSSQNTSRTQFEPSKNRENNELRTSREKSRESSEEEEEVGETEEEEDDDDDDEDDGDRFVLLRSMVLGLFNDVSPVLKILLMTKTHFRESKQTC